MTPNFITLSVTFLPNFNFKCLSYELYDEFTEIWYLFTELHTFADILLTGTKLQMQWDITETIEMCISLPLVFECAE